MLLSISDLKEVPEILKAFYKLFEQMVLFIPNPYRAIIIFYIALFIIILTYKMIRGV